MIKEALSKMNRIIAATSLVLLYANLAAVSPGGVGVEPWVILSESGGSIRIMVDGITEFEGVSSVTFSDGNKTHRVGMDGFELLEPVQNSVCQTPFGEAVATRATFGRQGSSYQFTLTLKRLKNLRAFTLQGVFHNHSDQDVKLSSFELLDARKNSGGRFEVENPDEWLVTPLMESTPAVSLAESNARLKEAAMVYHQDGVGFLAGPVGPAEAYTNVQFIDQTIVASVEMDGVLVRAGESRRSEEMIFCFESSRTATDIWTRWVAITHKARLHRGAVYGWCSWYDRTTKIDEAHVMAVTRTIQANPNVFGKGIIQIDDGYQKMDGDWSANEKFPSGMAVLAEHIREAGCIPGVWFAPLMMHPDHPWSKAHPDAMQKNAQGMASFMNPNSFHPDGANWINPSHPEAQKFLFSIIKDARDRGYGYIKIDFNGIGSDFVDPTKTRLQVFRELYAIYREAAGEEMYILSCLGSPTRGVIGYVDSARVGPDSHPAHFDKCLKSVLRFQIYHDIWWQNDPDVAYIAEILPSRNLGPVRQGEGMWRSWLASVALTGGTAMISEPVNLPDTREHWRNFEIMRPASREPARLLTLGQSPDNEVFGFAAERPYGDFAVYNLYNSTAQPRRITLDFLAAGIPTGVPCAVYDFWNNRLLGYAVDRYTTDELDPLSSRLLRFTPLDPGKAEAPVLVGSNLHLSVGATEIVNVRYSESKVTIDLSNAGAQDGDLLFHSKLPLKAVRSGNCTTGDVEELGNNLWKVHLRGRMLSEQQFIELAVGGDFLPGDEAVVCKDHAAEPRLNIILVLVDDLGWADLGVTGSLFYETPNIDALAKEGVFFSDAYAASPVCTPTRASIMSGKYPSRMGITNHSGIRGPSGPGYKLDPPDPNGSLPLEEFTIAEALQAAGYKTAHIGKWHLQDHNEAGRDHFPEAQGFGINIAGHDAGQPGSYFFPYMNEDVPWSNVPDLEDGAEGEYLTDRLTDEAIQFIRGAKGSAPFFLNLWYYSVHTPIEGKQDKVEKFRKKAASMGILGDKDTVPEHASFHRRHQNVPEYAAMVESVDENIGRILDTLQSEGLAENTAILFFSDNGGLSTGPGPNSPTSNLPLRAGKAWIYEGGIRVPMIIKCPGIAYPGSTNPEPVISTDLYPTMLDLAGLPLRPGQHVDGVSLKKLLSGNAGTLDRDAIYFHYPHYHPVNTMGPAGAVRMGDFKLVEIFETGEVELYDLSHDIGETNNLAESMPELKARMKKVLSDWRQEAAAAIPADPKFVGWANPWIRLQ